MYEQNKPYTGIEREEEKGTVVKPEEISVHIDICTIGAIIFQYRFFEII